MNLEHAHSVILALVVLLCLFVLRMWSAFPIGLAIACCIGLTSGCALWPRPLPPPDPPLRIVVAPAALTVSIKNSSQLYSFESPPSEEREPFIRAQLIDLVEAKAQDLLIEYLAMQPGFQVTPFAETRRLTKDLNLPRAPLDQGQLDQLGAAAGAELVVSARIGAYGTVPWKYWVSGLATQNLAELLVLGFSTGWNPIAIGAWAATDMLLLDLPLWAGGAYIFGWAFRPVEIDAQALQLHECVRSIWKETEFVNLVPWQTLASYPPEERKKKEVQLGASLDKAMKNISEAAGKELRVKPCV